MNMRQKLPKIRCDTVFGKSEITFWTGARSGANVTVKSGRKQSWFYDSEVSENKLMLLQCVIAPSKTF